MPRHVKLDYWVCDRYPWGCNIHHDTKEDAKSCPCRKVQDGWSNASSEKNDIPKLGTGMMGGIMITGSNDIDDESYTKPKSVESYE